MQIISSRTGLMAPSGTIWGERADMSGQTLNIMARSNRVRLWYILGRLLAHVQSLRLEMTCRLWEGDMTHHSINYTGLNCTGFCTGFSIRDVISFYAKCWVFQKAACPSSQEIIGRSTLSTTCVAVCSNQYQFIPQAQLV